MAAEIHVGDIGTLFKMTIKDENSDIVDISNASVSFLFKRPDGTVVTKSTAFYTDGTDGIATYQSESGFLNMPNIWFLQAVVDFGGTEFHSDFYKFNVIRNLEE